MAATPATAFNGPMTSLTGNSGGNVPTLPNVNQVGGRERVFIGSIVFASQASGTVFGVARLPQGAAITSIEVITDTSTGSATLAFGNAADTNAAIYGAAAAVTTVNAKQSFCKQATLGVPINSGIDCQSAAAAPYEDVIMTVGAAALPGAGNLTTIIKYVID